MIYLGIGSNLGNRRSNIEKVKFRLIQDNIKILKSSSYYESLSWPNKRNPKFLNIVLQIDTNLTPKELLFRCKVIEKSFGRKKGPKNSPRICDIDVLDYKMMLNNEKIILPHPRLHRRNFVLLPLYELDKNWCHPISKYHIKRLIFSLSLSDIRSIKQI